jgi:hypothetical protein
MLKMKGKVAHLTHGEVIGLKSHRGQVKPEEDKVRGLKARVEKSEA